MDYSSASYRMLHQFFHAMIESSRDQRGNPLNAHRYTERRLNQALERLFQNVAKQSAISARNQNFSRQVQFISINLNEEDKQTFQQWVSEVESDFGQLLGEHVHAGHKYSLSWDEYNETFTAACTCWSEGSNNFGKCVSAKHKDAITALMLVYYKAVIYGDETKSWSNSASSDWG